MATVVCIPDLGDAQNVEVVEICVAPGERVAAGAALIVLESDKASMEVPAPVAGTVTALELAEGDAAVEGQPICQIAETEDKAPAAEKADPDPEPEAADAAEPAAAQSRTQAEALASPEGPEEIEGEGVAAGSADLVDIDVRVPDIGDASDVTVVEVCVAPGDIVADDAALVVLESDKASMEVPAGNSGEVLSVDVAEGDVVAEGVLLARIRGPQSVSQPSPPQRHRTTADPVPPAPRGSPPPASTITGAATGTPAGSDVYAGPAVRRLAREMGVDLTQVKATGARNRVLKEDVQAYVKQRLSSSSGSGGLTIEPVPLPDFSRYGEIELEPLTRIQRAGAMNLQRSWLNLPHVTHHDEVDVTELEEFRAGLRAEGEKRGTPMTPLAFLIKACVAALREHPRLNASLDADRENYILKRFYNIGIAVDTPAGLLVPVIRNADQKGLWELAAEVRDVAALAREGLLRPDQMQGGSFSLSSLGGLGGTAFTPIINAPEVAILGVAKVAVKPLWDGENFQPRKMMPLSLSYDHRAINGAEGARFTTAVMGYLSDIRAIAD